MISGEWATLCESQSKLEPITGPGYTGMQNLGNTCYMNSLMQVLFTIPSFIEDYVKSANDTFNSTTNFANPDANFQLQMSKLGSSLWSGDYSSAGEESGSGIRPAMFKNLIGKGHSEFSGKTAFFRENDLKIVRFHDFFYFAGKGQQDAQEFYLHLLNTIQKENHKMGKTKNAFDCLRLEVEDRFECGLTGKVKYKTR